MHFQDAAIKKQYRMLNSSVLDRLFFEEKVQILKQINDHNRLKITEALN